MQFYGGALTFSIRLAPDHTDEHSYGLRLEGLMVEADRDSLDPGQVLRFTLSEHHFKADLASCNASISGFENDSQGVVELIQLRDADVAVVSMRAHSCLMHYTSDRRAQSALLNDTEYKNRSGFLAVTVNSVASGKITDERLIAEFLPRLAQAPIARDRKVSFLNYISREDNKTQVSDKTRALVRLSLSKLD